MKPENLLYNRAEEGSTLKLCDFGFAKIDNGDMATPQFTPYYASPQVCEKFSDFILNLWKVILKIFMYKIFKVLTPYGFSLVVTTNSKISIIYFAFTNVIIMSFSWMF